MEKAIKLRLDTYANREPDLRAAGDTSYLGHDPPLNNMLLL